MWNLAPKINFKLAKEHCTVVEIKAGPDRMWPLDLINHLPRVQIVHVFISSRDMEDVFMPLARAQYVAGKWVASEKAKNRDITIVAEIEISDKREMAKELVEAVFTIEFGLKNVQFEWW